ncbi:MAG: GNAT family N-acetyltransferase [Candidatus Thorarchaeota archaeon]
MLKGKRVNLRLLEKDELPLIREWLNEQEIEGEFEPISQVTIGDLEKQYETNREGQWFVVQKSDGTKIGYIAHFLSSGHRAIGYALLPSERGQGYGTESVLIMVDYLFLTKNIVRIQAETHPQNIASHRVLEKAGFVKEGVIRQSFFSRGVWRDTVLFSILREEWKGPRILPNAP